MADHRGSLIMDAVIAKIGTDTSAGKHVYRSAARALPPSAKSSIEVHPGADEDPEIIGNSFIDSSLTVYVDLLVEANQPANRAMGVTPAYEKALWTLRKEVHVKLMATINQGLTFVVDTLPLGAAEIEYDGQGDSVVAVQSTRWRIKYRTSRADPSA